MNTLTFPVKLLFVKKNRGVLGIKNLIFSIADIFLLLKILCRIGLG